ncbi:hypothetical protein [Bradyrhizobium sp. 25ACV]
MRDPNNGFIVRAAHWSRTAGRNNMKDLRRRLEKLRSDAREFALMSQRGTDVEKRELFERLADELAIEALELEQIVKQKEQSDPSDQHEVVELRRPERKRG